MHFLPGRFVGAVSAAGLAASAAFGGGAEVISISPPPQTPGRVVGSVALPNTFELTVGFADILRIEGNVSTIVLGEPSIADASPLDAGTILLTGRTPGTTNLIALDESGNVLADLLLHVGSRQPGSVTVRRALDVQVYTCASGLCDGSSPPVTAEVAPAAEPALASSSQ